MSSSTNDVLVVSKFVLGPLATNCYLAYGSVSRKGILIDPACHDVEIDGCIRQNDIDILYVLNTHGHADHIGGNASFGSPVLIHEFDEPCLRDPAERLLKGGERIPLDGLELEIIHTPGHTPGGISVLHDDMLFSGDTLFREGIGRADLPGSDYELLLRSIREKLMVLPDTVKVFPGHGPETTIGHERQNNPFL